MSGKVGRPSSAKAETVLVQHVGTGEVVAWSDGQFAGNSSDTKKVSRHLYETRASVDFGDGNPISITHSAQGAAYAMLAACAGQGRIISTNHGHLPTDKREV